MYTRTAELEYVGFWARTGASLIDTFLTLLCTLPLLSAVYGRSYWLDPQASVVRGPSDFLITWVLPAVIVVLFWMFKQATPGKMAVGARIVDVRSGEAASTGQLIGRYLGYFISALVFGLGFFWVAFDSRKQGWHDKLAGTVVVRRKGGAVEPVQFMTDRAVTQF